MMYKNKNYKNWSIIILNKFAFTANDWTECSLEWRYRRMAIGKIRVKSFEVEPGFPMSACPKKQT